MDSRIKKIQGKKKKKQLDVLPKLTEDKDNGGLLQGLLVFSGKDFRRLLDFGLLFHRRCLGLDLLLDGLA